MRFGKLLIGSLLASIVSPAWACQQEDEYLNDPIPSPGFSLAVAEVRELRVTRSSGSEPCLSVDYELRELLFGTIGDAFTVASCSQEGPITEADLSGLDSLANQFGFVEGATVLVGVITWNDGSNGFRYAIPNCFGPFHLRLDLMGETDREVLIAYFKDMLAEGEAAAPP